MPVLPLIDLLLLGGWTSLFAGFILKVVALTTSYRPTILGMSSTDFFLVAVAAMLFSIALAARTWVKSQQPAERAVRLHKQTMDAYNALPGHQATSAATGSSEDGPANPAGQPHGAS